MNLLGKLSLAGLAGLCATAALAVGGTPALAAVEYEDACGTSAFCEIVSESEPIGVAVDNSKEATQGDVYVVRASGALVQYSAAGEAPVELSVPNCVGAHYAVVDPSNGNIFVSCLNSSTVSEITSSGAAVAGFGNNGTLEGLATPTGVAIDQAGKLLVAERGSTKVSEYKLPAGTKTGEFEFGPYGEEADSLAVDSAGNVYLAFEKSQIVKYEAGDRSKSATFASGGEDNAVAVDRSTNDVFVANNSKVIMYRANGTVVTSFGAFDQPPAFGVGVNDSSHSVYTTEIEAGKGFIFTRKSSAKPELDASVSPVNSGTLECEDKTASPGVKGACQAEYETGHEIVVTEKPEAGFTFVEWGGACSGATCEVTMTESLSVEARFSSVPLAKFQLEVKVKGEGEVKSGGTIACTEVSGTCTEEVEETRTVTLTANPSAGSVLHEWKGVSCNGGNTSTTCEFAMPKAVTKVEAEFAVSKAAPLTVYVAGAGKVNSSPSGITECTASGGVCTFEFEGTVTLTATPEAGDVFVGWLGCKHTGANTCTVNVTGETEVTAVFLQEGKEGKEGKTGSQGPKGETGAAGAAGAAGSQGPQGEKGANGANGANGAQGPAGPAGPAGPEGKQGPAGTVQIVTCTKHGKKKKCTTKTVSGTVKFTTSSVRATLSRHGVVFAAGVASAHGSMSLRMKAMRKLRPGHYTLTLIGGSGRNEHIHSETFTLG